MFSASASHCLLVQTLLALLQALNAQVAPGPSPNAPAAAILMRAGWASHAGWNMATQACSWKGVSCNASHIVAINLRGTNLTGTLPQAWSQLTELKSLDLAENHLKGTLPAAYSNLSQLTVLHLGGNSFNGTLPDAWSAFSQVQILNLTGNLLSGTLPGSWGMLSNVTELCVSHNLLTGSLPGSWGNPQLAGFNESLPNSLPGAWSNVSTHQSNASQATLKDDTIYRNGTLSKLAVLDLSHNMLTGPVPEEWGGLQQLVSLHLDSNRLSGSLPATFSYLKQLAYICLTGNDVTGSLPESWGNLNLGALILANMNLSGTLPPSWGTHLIPKLKYLELGENKLSGTLPAAWSNLRELLFISIFDNLFTGSIPSTWQWEKVGYGNFGHNRLTGAVPLMSNATQYLDMYDNRLSRHSMEQLPDSIRVLCLGNNRLEGTYPNASHLPRDLTILDLSDNLLTGTLPEHLPAQLTAFNISRNKLEGTLPNSWNVSLVDLRLDGNDFWGKLPPSWARWGKTSSNSLQLTMLNTQVHGHMPQQWVQQFCLAIVKNSSSQMLFTPNTTMISFWEGDAEHTRELVSFGSVIEMDVQHASINVTLAGRNYSFNYANPELICSIPHAARNVWMVWGAFGAALITIVVGLKVWLIRKDSSSSRFAAGTLTILRSVRSAVDAGLNVKSVQLPKRIARKLWFLVSDVVWYVYSQVTDAITIHQVFHASTKFGWLLLGILLLPFIFIGLLTARVCVKQCISRIGAASHESSRSKVWVHQAGALLAGVLMSPFLFLGLQLNMILEGLGISVASCLPFTGLNMSALYRAQSTAEVFLSAFPQAVIQTKLYMMGNDPNGVRVYIDTTLFMYSVVGSLISVLKTAALIIYEVHQCNDGFVGYLGMLVDFYHCQPPLEEGLKVQPEILSSFDNGPIGKTESSELPMGRATSGTVLLPHTQSAELKE